MEAKRNIIDIIILAALITALIIRMFSNDTPWVSFVNYISLIVSFFSLYGEIHLFHNNHRLFPFFTGIFVILIVVLTIIAVLIFLSVIKVDARFNDCVMIITLMIALPSRLYINISNKIFK